MPFFSKVFRAKDGAGAGAAASSSPSASALEQGAGYAPPKPRWEDAWLRTEVDPDEVQQLLHGCTVEVKSRGLTLPFLLLPFRPHSDASAAKLFVRNYFNSIGGGRGSDVEAQLQHELRLTEPMVLCSVLKWCWSRLPGGVVTWEAYDLFRVGEQDSSMARDSFATFLPLSVDSDARMRIIFDYFDLLAAIAAHGKTNGFGGRKLSRLAGWWAFAHTDQGEGFDGGYRSWARAADATSHLFFAYLRSLCPDAAPGTDSIMTLPRSLQALLQATEYPPQTPVLMQRLTAKVVMIVDSVSPTPFALLRRAKHFDYRDDDRSLRAFAEFEDPVLALTEECRRVLQCISSTNQSLNPTSKYTNDQREGAWSRFEDLGFSSMMDEPEGRDRSSASTTGLSTTARSRNLDHGRPTTPSWADFLSAGFVDQPTGKDVAPLLLPPDKVLPPIALSRAQSSQSNWAGADEEYLEPGELASITMTNLDDSFWWVWINSLAAEEPPERKAVFGRCAVIETDIAGGHWLVVEEKVKGAAPLPIEGAHIVEKKSRFGLTKKGRGISWRGKGTGSKSPPPLQETPYGPNRPSPQSRSTLGQDQHARIQAAAAALQQKQRQQRDNNQNTPIRRARTEDILSTKTNSVFTLQPIFISEAAPAMKWAHKFDRDIVQEAYLAKETTGNGAQSPPPLAKREPGVDTGPSKTNLSTAHQDSSKDRDLPALPREEDSPRPRPIQSFTDPAAGGLTALSPPPAHHQVVEAQVLNGALQPTEILSSTAETESSPQTDYFEQSAAPVDQPELAGPHQARSNGKPTDSPLEARKAAKRLQKRGGGAGFKKLFGRKNTDPPPSPVPHPGSKSLSPPDSPPPSVGRRLSNLRKKSSPKVTPVPLEKGPETPTLDIPRSRVPSSRVPSSRASMDSVALISGPPVENSRETWPPAPESSTGTESRQNSVPNEDALNFHQGPLQDIPAFIPDAATERSVSPAATKEPAEVVEQDDTVSEQSVEATQTAPPPPPLALDRWAQIRKNAAERVAAQANPESSTPGQTVRSDDGETSGEETIESRVARIKARVAELTGNMDDQNNVRPSQNNVRPSQNNVRPSQR